MFFAKTRCTFVVTPVYFCYTAVTAKEKHRSNADVVFTTAGGKFERLSSVNAGVSVQGMFSEALIMRRSIPHPLFSLWKGESSTRSIMPCPMHTKPKHVVKQKLYNPDDSGLRSPVVRKMFFAKTRCTFVETPVYFCYTAVTAKKKH